LIVAASFGFAEKEQKLRLRVLNILFKVVAEIVDGRKVPDLARVTRQAVSGNSEKVVN